MCVYVCVCWLLKSRSLCPASGACDGDTVQQCLHLTYIICVHMPTHMNTHTHTHTHTHTSVHTHTRHMLTNHTCPPHMYTCLCVFFARRNVNPLLPPLPPQCIAMLKTWPKLTPECAMELLDYQYPDTDVRKWAVECLKALT